MINFQVLKAAIYPAFIYLPLSSIFLRLITQVARLLSVLAKLLSYPSISKRFYEHNLIKRPVSLGMTIYQKASHI